MTHSRLGRLLERWFRLLLRAYPSDFRDELGAAIVDAYRRRADETLKRRGVIGLAAFSLGVLAASLWNGAAERLRPAASWRQRGWGRDMQIVRRRLIRSPLFVAATVGTLTVGLGAFAVVYTALDKILLEPMPYRDPDDLYFVWRDNSTQSGLTRDWLAGREVAELQRSPVVEQAAGMQMVVPTISRRVDSEPLQAVVMLTSPNLFDVLGVAPAMGRAFVANEVGPDRPSVVVLSHAMWTRLGADPSIVGSQVWMSGTSYTVIGVMGPDFRFVRHTTLGSPQEADAYLSFRFHLADQDPKNTTFAALIRLRRGTSPEQAAAAVDAAASIVNERDYHGRGLKLYAVGLKADLVERVRPVLLTLASAGAFLVLVLAGNLASLLLARAAEREREFAISRAVGADGSAVARAMVLEGGVLGLVGGVTGALAGMWGTRTLVLLAPLDLPRRSEIALDSNVAVVVIGVGAALGIIAALLPAAWASRVSLAALMATAGVRGTGGSVRMRRAMVVTQIALSLVLLSAGGLVVRSFDRLLAADPGFRPDGLLTFTAAMGPRLFPKPAEALAFQDRLEIALRALPRTTGVSATTALPLSASAGQDRVAIPGAPGNTGDPERDSIPVDIIATRADYVDVMGMTVIAGRGFSEARREGVREALIDRHLAAQFFPTRTPLGAAIPFGDSSLTIVGVVEQARLYDLHQDGRPQLFVRAEDWTPYTPSFVVRTEGDPHALIPEVRRVIRQLDSRIPVSSLQTMDEIVNNALRQPRISAVLIASFAVGALLLVAMGLFGMVSGSVSRRRGELAVRLALGATHQRVLTLVLGEGALLIGLGMLIGIPGVYAAGRLVQGLLIDISPWDPGTLLFVAVGMALVTLAACYLPARRVLVIDPALLLRQE
jgi:putative ABC transport system permease protein